VSTEPDDHRRLRERLRTGDHDAFTGLYREHVGAVFALAHRLTGSRGLAEEVTAETFLVAWRARAEVEVDERPLLPWLLGIAARQSMNATRGVRRRLAYLSRRPAPAAVEDFADETVARIDDARLLRRTQEALGSLTRAEAEVVGLCVWSGLSYAEAADALDVPVGTVRSRLARARARLRALTADDPTPSSREARR
jgi:RNA polymerase sigma factor (sigma-70 family)